LTGPVGVATPTLEDAGLPAQPASLVVEAPADPPEEPALRHPFHEALPSPAGLAQGPAHRLANLSPADCRRRLSEAELPLERWRGPAPGVATPLRLVGPLLGVEFRVPPPKSPFGLLDCRLALALQEMSGVLAEHG